MAAEADHIKLANRNDAALKLLMASPSHPEWVVTIAFYKAVHIVEAVFDHTKGWHSTSHDQRLNSLKSLTVFKPIFKPFRSLYGLSRIARYLVDSSGRGYGSFADAMPDSDVDAKVVQGFLKTVENNSLAMLSSSAQTALTRV